MFFIQPSSQQDRIKFILFIILYIIIYVGSRNYYPKLAGVINLFGQSGLDFVALIMSAQLRNKFAGRFSGHSAPKSKCLKKVTSANFKFFDFGFAFANGFKF